MLIMVAQFLDANNALRYSFFSLMHQNKLEIGPMYWSPVLLINVQLLTDKIYAVYLKKTVGLRVNLNTDKIHNNMNDQSIECFPY